MYCLRHTYSASSLARSNLASNPRLCLCTLSRDTILPPTVSDMKTILLYLAALLHLAFANAQYGSPESSDTSTTPTASISATAAAGAASETQTIQVGQGGFIFQPDTITADKGDVIRFDIHNTHSVARSAFDNPCQPIGGAQNIWTGFPNDNTIFSLTINDTSPIWLYCAAPQHCQSGMAMVINPP